MREVEGESAGQKREQEILGLWDTAWAVKCPEVNSDRWSHLN